MVLQLRRFGYEEDAIKNTTPIEPPQTLRLNEHSDELQLNNIIVHLGTTVRGGHYIAYFKCNGKWYLYNDLRDRIERVGTYDQLLNHPIITKDGSRFEYSGTVANNCYLLFYGINDQTI